MTESAARQQLLALLEARRQQQLAKLGDLPGWAEQLSNTHFDVVAAIGPWLPRLRAALGPLLTPLARGDGAPDGVDGLTRRGTYERLLMTEWLLADEAPDEFLRRAATREHAFLALARQAPHGERRVVALLDAGPEQLGAPRVAQLAILHALLRRATEAGAQLLWGTVQAPDRGLFDTLTHATFRGAATLKCVSEAQLSQWRETLEDDTEIWLIGGRRLGQQPGGERRITIDTPLFRDALTVEISHPQTRQLELEITDKAALKRALRRPSTPATPPPPPPRRMQQPYHITRHTLPQILPQLRFDRCGDRLFARTINGDLVGMHVPKSRYVKPGRTRIIRRQHPDAHVVAAVPHARSRFDIIEQRGARITLRTARCADVVVSEPDFVAPAGPTRATRIDADQVLVVDGANTQYLLHTRAQVLHRVAAGAFFELDLDRRQWLFGHGPPTDDPKLSMVARAKAPDPSLTEPLLGFGGGSGLQGCWAGAYEISPETWALWGAHVPQKTVACSLPVLGVSRHRDIGLVVRLSVRQLGFMSPQKGLVPFEEQPAAIGPVAVSASSPHIAYCELDDEGAPTSVVIWGLDGTPDVSLRRQVRS